MNTKCSFFLIFVCMPYVPSDAIVYCAFSCFFLSCFFSKIFVFQFFSGGSISTVAFGIVCFLARLS